MSDTLREILNQPTSWSTTIAAIEADIADAAGPWLSAADTRVVLFGCGSSYHLAKSAAHIVAELTGRASHAVPASEIFLSAPSVLPDSRPTIAVAISRSGFTSEVLMAVDYLKSNHPSVPVLAVTCRAESPLSQLDHAIVLPWADEASVVMTQSWTNMLLAIELLVAGEGRPAHVEELRRLPEYLDSTLPDLRIVARDLGSRVAGRESIYLGLGARQGVAEEATLKLREMTQAHCQADNPLEFRHGPISTVTRDSVVWLLAGAAERSYLPDLVSTLRERGALVTAVSPYDITDVDRLIPLPDTLSEVARTVLYLPVLQLVAYEAARAAGLDPDRPRNLEQVVVL